MTQSARLPEEFWTLVLFMVAFACATAYLGYAKNRLVFLWLLSGFLLGPLAFLYGLFQTRAPEPGNARLPDRPLFSREIADLDRLASLKERGLLSEQEFVDQRINLLITMNAGPGRVAVGVRAVVILAVLLALILAAVVYNFPTFRPVLPNCFNQASLRRAITTFKEGPAGKVRGLEIVSLQNMYEARWTASEMNCRGLAKLNDGSTKRVGIRFYIERNDLFVETSVEDLR